jgi:hypothetical protein
VQESIKDNFLIKLVFPECIRGFELGFGNRVICAKHGDTISQEVAAFGTGCHCFVGYRGNT